MIVYEVLSGELHPAIIEESEFFFLEEIVYLIVERITDQYICITNTFKNVSILMKTEEWHGKGAYPIGLKKYIEYPSEPLKELDCSAETASLYEQTATFIIVLSYKCNLHCKYCYQQCNEKLDKHAISDENLLHILNVIEQFHNEHPEKMINIGLFGGEPLLPENYDNIIKIFDFCVENQFSVSVTTNGINLPYYLKPFIIYSGLNIMVETTIDSIVKNELTRFSSERMEDACSSRILKSVLTLINNGVNVSVEMNIDKHNIDEIAEMIDFYQDCGFLDNPLFHLGIGLVDDRRYETGYMDVVTQTELILKLEEYELLHNNIYFAFVKTPLNLCKKIYCNFKQSDAKYVPNYCWVSAPLDYVFYIDADLDVFRCPYSVGRKEYSLFKLTSIAELEKYELPNATYLDRECCKKCNIGGYCSGGCGLSADVDFDRMCACEKTEFDKFLNKIYYPKLRSMIELM